MPLKCPSPPQLATGSVQRINLIKIYQIFSSNQVFEGRLKDWFSQSRHTGCCHLIRWLGFSLVGAWPNGSKDHMHGQSAGPDVGARNG